MDPELRRKCEGRVLRQYYDTLTQSRGPSDPQNAILNTNSYTYEDFMREYKACGSGRLLYIMGFSCTLVFPDDKMQRFVDLTTAILKDNDVTPENADMFRPT